MSSKNIKYKAVLRNFDGTKHFVSEAYGIDSGLWKIFKNESFIGVELVTCSKKFLKDIPETQWEDSWSIIELIQGFENKDDNGIEIFEGDYIQCIDSEGDEYITLVKEYGEIQVQNCDYDFTLLKWATDVDIQELYIIGNKFENPEIGKNS